MFNRSISVRQHFEESELSVFETACSVLPAHTDTSAAAAAGAIVTALRHASEVLPSDSSKVGRTLLAALHKLKPFLAASHALKESFSFVVDRHASPLQRPIELQIKKIN